jgi:hypothetical protein
MTLLKLRVPFFADGFARNFMCACTKFLWSSQMTFLRSLPASVKLNLLFFWSERLQKLRKAHMAIFGPVRKRG